MSNAIELYRATWHDKGMIQRVGIEQLYLSPRRPVAGIPRVSQALQELVNQFGAVQPVVVRCTEPRRYEILANPETWLAAQRAGLHHVPIVVREAASDDEADALLRLKAPENPIRMARRYAQRLDAGQGRARGAISALARDEGCSRTHVAHLLRLLSLPELVQTAVQEGMLNLGQAKALLGCDSTDQQMGLAAQAIRERWSVRRTEAAVRDRHIDEQSRAHNADAGSRQVHRLERRLSEQLGTPVRLDTQAGTLTLDYRHNLAVLDGLLERFGYRADG